MRDNANLMNKSLLYNVENSGAMKMYISKIKIKNFRNLKDFEIELKPFTTIIGENNVGKSNLLEAISLVLSNEISVYKKRKLEIEDFSIQTIHQFKKDMIDNTEDQITFPEIRIDLYFMEPDLEQEPIVERFWYDYDSKLARISYLYSYQSPKKKEYISKTKQLIKEKGKDAIEFVDFPIEDYEYSIVWGKQDSTVENYWSKMLKVEYLDALRDVKRELNSNSDKKLLYRILNDRDAPSFSLIKEQMLALDNAVKNDKSVLEVLKKDIGNYLNKISLETETSTNTVDFQFGSIELSEILKKIGMQYGDEAVSIERNGLGRNNLLYIAVILAHLYEKENNFFRVIVIEEPEAHLCPIVQKHLAENLVAEDGKGKQQILVTTHSTHIASYLELKNTVVMYKNGNCIDNHYLLEGFNENKSKDRQSIRYLQKWLNATNSTMFFTRKLIFVEGIAEEILLPVFYQWKYGKSLQKAGCQIINVNGVAFANFLNIVKNGYFIRTAVITDSDVGKSTEKRADDLKREYDSNIINVCITQNQGTFEKEIFDCNKSQKKKRQFLAEILGIVRPNKCNDVFKKQQIEKFDIDELFECVEEYKSEFAFELSEALEKKLTAKHDIFDVPQYIIDAFEFID